MIPVKKGTYLTGLFVIFLSAYSQYFVEGYGPLTGALVVYGIPIIWISVFFGPDIIGRAFRNNALALKYGMGYFGVFSVLGAAVSGIIILVLTTVDPQSLELLDQANPVLHVPRKLAWIMVFVSILGIGPAEEYIFRGFVFGGLLTIYHNRHWIFLAFVSSVLFAAVHFYYLVVFGLASIIPFAEIVMIGMALGFAYYLSGGNLLIPALIHGAFDATGFIAEDISEGIGFALRFSMVLIGLLVAFMMYRRRNRPAESAAS
jgi:membrane protease YdiL (CAAX protease family)